MNSPRYPLSALLLCALLLLIPNAPAQAGSAFWNVNPISSDWNDPANWTPATVPNGASDVATFAVSNQTAVTVSEDIEVAQIDFAPGASSFAITTFSDATLTLSNQGVTNNSGAEQDFFITANQSAGAGTILFANAASAGEETFYVVGGAERPDILGGLLRFYDNSTAAGANITTNAPTVNRGGGGTAEFYGKATAGSATILNHRGTTNGPSGGHTYFYENSNAGTANIINEATQTKNAFSSQTVFYDASSAGSASFTNEGCPIAGVNNSAVTWFFGTSTADNATFTLHGGTRGRGEPGEVFFRDSSSSGNAIFLCDNLADGNYGGNIRFEDTSVGGTCRFVFLDRGTSLNLVFEQVPLTLGSIEGFGRVMLSKSPLKVGSNGLDTTFSGLIQGPGSLIKIGKGQLVLGGANTYTKGTEVKSGALIVNNKTGSATGTGAVIVSRGTLGGKGGISGQVTLGKGDSIGVTLAPGIETVGLLSIGRNLIFSANGTYRWKVDSETAKADEVAAFGVTISNQAMFSAHVRGDAALPIGTVLTVIDNTAATAISGQFSNLADGSNLVVGPNTLQANYEGGDGNDLTLTVVP